MNKLAHYILWYYTTYTAIIMRARFAATIPTGGLIRASRKIAPVRSLGWQWRFSNG